MDRRVLLAVLTAIGLVLAASGGCGKSDDAGSGATAADGSFVVDANGTTRDFTMQNGEVFTFVFPPSAAGKQLTIRPVTDASIGLAGRFPNLLELLPHGTTFSPPVRVIQKPYSKGNILATFASAESADTLELLTGAADGSEAYELAHFSYFGSLDAASHCTGTITDTIQTPTSSCCVGGIEHVYGCTLPPPNCMTWTSPPVCVGATAQSPCGSWPTQLHVMNNCASDGGTDASPGGGSKFDGPIGGCPDVGQYSVAASGTCGDLDTAAPRQRIDGLGCELYFEYDSGKGVSSGKQTFAATGTTPNLKFKLGTGAFMCTATTAHNDQVDLDCHSGAVACDVFMVRTGPL
jgi:hypothetical protein